MFCCVFWLYFQFIRVSDSAGSQLTHINTGSDTDELISCIFLLRSVFYVGIYLFQTVKTGDFMDISSLLIFLAIGAIAGWLAGNIMKGRGFGVIGNIVVGIIGALLGGFVFSLVGVSAGGLIGSIFTSTVGAILLLYVIRLVK